MSDSDKEYFDFDVLYLKDIFVSELVNKLADDVVDGYWILRVGFFEGYFKYSEE